MSDRSNGVLESWSNGKGVDGSPPLHYSITPSLQQRCLP